MLEGQAVGLTRNVAILIFDEIEVSAGIDAAFDGVARLSGKEAALETARDIEYDWRHEAG